MKTQIQITGQCMGNSKLRNAILTANCTEKRVFGGFILTFKTKLLAVIALSEGYKYLCNEMPEEKGKVGGINYSRGSSLSWDASKAVIL